MVFAIVVLVKGLHAMQYDCESLSTMHGVRYTV